MEERINSSCQTFWISIGEFLEFRSRMLTTSLLTTSLFRVTQIVVAVYRTPGITEDRMHRGYRGQRSSVAFDTEEPNWSSKTCHQDSISRGENQDSVATFSRHPFPWVCDDSLYKYLAGKLLDGRDNVSTPSLSRGLQELFRRKTKGHIKVH